MSSRMAAADPRLGAEARSAIEVPSNQILLEPHHADPFDRLLIAQAQASERATIVTEDLRIRAYEVDVLW